MNSADVRDDDVPVLTEIVADEATRRSSVPNAAGIEALAEQLERALLERLRPEIDRVTARALDRVRAELTVSVLQTVREAVAASVAQTLGKPRRD
jgi:hypothetical protein